MITWLEYTFHIEDIIKLKLKTENWEQKSIVQVKWLITYYPLYYTNNTWDIKYKEDESDIRIKIIYIIIYYIKMNVCVCVSFMHF